MDLLNQLGFAPNIDPVCLIDLKKYPYIYQKMGSSIFFQRNSDCFGQL